MFKHILKRPNNTVKSSDVDPVKIMLSAYEETLAVLIEGSSEEHVREECMRSAYIALEHFILAEQGVDKSDILDSEYPLGPDIDRFA